jgi:hypothetical protein
MTNAIMGFAHGLDYNWPAIRPFIVSLREKAHFDGDIVIFTNSSQNENGFREDDRKKLSKYQVQELPVDLRWVPWGRGFLMARFWQFEKTIRESPQWDRLILADTRDVIWQSDLTKFFQDDDLHIPKEAISILQDKYFNSAGVLKSWGQSMLDEIGHETVLNCGTMWGGREALASLIEQMRSCGAAENCDQQSVNYLVYHKGLDAILHENDGKWVWTVAMIANLGYQFDDGLVYMEDGSLPSVVHQYDRHATLKEKIIGYYND